MQVEALRAQIRLLQAVSYNTVEEEDDTSDEGGAAGGRNGQAAGGVTAGSLEAALLQKNR
jgi:hypothetical protein